MEKLINTNPADLTDLQRRQMMFIMEQFGKTSINIVNVCFDMCVMDMDSNKLSRKENDCILNCFEKQQKARRHVVMHEDATKEQENKPKTKIMSQLMEADI